MSFQRARAAQQVADAPELPLPGDVIEGRYLVESELGRGGMGVVLAAHDQMLGRDVALKMLLPETLASRELFERFCNEARSLARLESRHVVRVLDFNVISRPPHSAGLPYMVLELLRGQDLFTYAREHGTLLPSTVVSFALQACDGLAAAHAAGIVHRDLKPENLFIHVEPDGSQVLKVVDFGVARQRGGRVLTGNQAGVGSPGYMAPEQVEGAQEVDARCDIWALGVVMYELLAQRPVFPGETPHSLCLQILTAPITPLQELRPELPVALVYIIERCLERDPARRFPNVAELAEALAPLDEANTDSAAARARRRLDAVSPLEECIVRPTPVPLEPISGSQPMMPMMAEVAVEEPVEPPQSGRRARRRRMVSGLLFAAAMLPALALMPTVARAPALEGARAWSSQALGSLQQALGDARKAWHSFWTEETALEAGPAQSVD